MAAIVLAALIVSAPHVSKILDCERKNKARCCAPDDVTRHPRLGLSRARSACTLAWSNSCSYLRVHAEITARAGRKQTVNTKGKERMSEAKRTKYVSFRLTDEEYTQLERAAASSGEEPNNWCRNLALTASREGPLFGRTGRLIYTELAVLRFLIGHGLKILFSRDPTEAAAWTKFMTQADKKADEIAKELLSRRK